MEVNLSKWNLLFHFSKFSNLHFEEQIPYKQEMKKTNVFYALPTKESNSIPVLEENKVLDFK